MLSGSAGPHSQVRVAGSKGVRVGENQLLGQVGAEGGVALAAGDEEDFEVMCAAFDGEVEIDGAEAGAHVTAPFMVRNEEQAVAAEVAC